MTLTVRDVNGNSAMATATVTILSIPIPTFPSLSQEFCAVDVPTIANIAVNDVGVDWFVDATSNQKMSLNSRIYSGIYYAAIGFGTCYSDRVAIKIIINDTAAPTGEKIQYFCKEKEYTIADLITNESEVMWYETVTGGIPLSAFTVLEDKQKYYASYLGTDCESEKRLEVEVVIRYCDVEVHNAVSANGDGKNDYLSIEGATFFSNNKLEIFNRFGNLVYETTRYGLEDNCFKGFGRYHTIKCVSKKNMRVCTNPHIFFT